MGTPFENFVNFEIPRRPVMFSFDITGYDGDPNDNAVPPFSNAPRGTFFLQRTGAVMWFKNLSTTPDWTQVSSGSGGGIQFVTTAERLALPVSAKLVVLDTDLNKMMIFDGDYWSEV